MGKRVVTEFVSLNGVMEAPGGEDSLIPRSKVRILHGPCASEWSCGTGMVASVRGAGFACAVQTL